MLVQHWVQIFDPTGLKTLHLITPNLEGGWAKSQPFFEYSKGKTGQYLTDGARAGIRTRVGGMKTHYDGPSYTTRATACPPTSP